MATRRSGPVARQLVRAGFAVLFVAAGTLHFLFPAAYVRIVPPPLPAPALLVALSGAAEVAGGAGLLVPRVRRAAAWGLIALLVAVFPANVYMALRPDVAGAGVPPLLLWLRLPLQGVLIWGVWWCAARPLTTAPSQHRTRAPARTA